MFIDKVIGYIFYLKYIFRQKIFNNKKNDYGIVKWIYFYIMERINCFYIMMEDRLCFQEGVFNYGKEFEMFIKE